MQLIDASDGRVLCALDSGELTVETQFGTVLSRGSDIAGIRVIPGSRIFFLQLADAPRLRMDVLQWSRHHRLFPGHSSEA